MKKIVFLANLVVILMIFSRGIYADGDLEKTLSLELLVPAVSFEIGQVSTNNYHTAFKFQVTDAEIFGGELTVTKALRGSSRHWVGGGLGHLEDSNDNAFISFDLDTFLSLNYKYYIRGIENQGFHFGAALKMFINEDLDSFPFLSFGYNF